MRVVVVLLLVFSAGCLASPPARQSLITDVAPLPVAPPGVLLSWQPPADPLHLAADRCEHFPFRIQSMGASVELDLLLQSGGNLTEGLEGKVAPAHVALTDGAPVDGDVTVCAPSNTPASAGRLFLVASAGSSSLALASMGLETTQKS